MILIMPGFSSISWSPENIHVEKAVGLHLNTGKRKIIGAGLKKTERFRKYHPGLFLRTISDIENRQRCLEYEFKRKNGLGLIAR